MKQILMIIFCLIGFGATAQSRDCNFKTSYGKIVPALKIFRLSKSKSLAVSGSVEKNIYSEFVLFECGKTEPISEWDGTQSCTIIQIKDTLRVSELYPVANGTNMSIKWCPFYVTDFYFENGMINNHSFFRKDLKKYNLAERRKTVTQFEQYETNDIKNNDAFFLSVKRLFWAYVSGSKKAENYLVALATKANNFDGGAKEEFNEIMGMFELYREKK